MGIMGITNPYVAIPKSTNLQFFLGKLIQRFGYVMPIFSAHIIREIRMGMSQNFYCNVCGVFGGMKTIMDVHPPQTIMKYIGI